MKEKDSGLNAAGLTMMALGTVIGGSFFLGSSIAIRTAGPSIILSYIMGGILVYLILYALSEMTAAEAAPGSFRTFSEKIFGPFVGFVVGWVYWTGMIFAMSSESVAITTFLRLWFPNISLPLAGSIIIILITLANLLGAERLSKLESGLAAIKLFAIVGFIVIALALLLGLYPGKGPVGFGYIGSEPFLPAGIGGIAGSMLMVMFAYAGFEIIGLAASEARNPHKTVPKAITNTVVSLVGLYILSIALILPFISTQNISEDVSPMVAALTGSGIGWAAFVINIVLVTAILSTMLAATFGLARMIRSLADEGHAPNWIKDKGDVPYKGILFSGAAMLASLWLGFMLPQGVYLFLVSSGGFSLLFSYLIIVMTHYKFRKKNGCPPTGNCQLKGYPYTSLIAIASLIIIIASMPLVPGQGAGLLAGLVLIAFYSICYMVSKMVRRYRRYSYR